LQETPTLQLQDGETGKSATADPQEACHRYVPASLPLCPYGLIATSRVRQANDSPTRCMSLLRLAPLVVQVEYLVWLPRYANPIRGK